MGATQTHTVSTGYNKVLKLTCHIVNFTKLDPLKVLMHGRILFFCLSLKSGGLETEPATLNGWGCLVYAKYSVTINAPVYFFSSLKTMV